MTKILDKVTKLEKAVVNSTDQTLIHSTRVPKKKTFAEIVDKDVKQAPAAVETKNISSKSSSFIPPALPPAKNEPIPSKPVKNTSFLRQEKVLFVGDTVGHTGNRRVIEKSRKCRIKSAIAYSSNNNNDARWPELNIADVVDQNLKNPGREEYDILVLSAPTVDITNLNTSRLANNNTETLELQAIESSKNMFNIAQNSLTHNKNLKKVIIMVHTPRF